MRFSSDWPDQAALQAMIAAEGEMEDCPDCGQPVSRPRAIAADLAWKRHFDFCEPHLERTAREDAEYLGDDSA